MITRPNVKEPLPGGANESSFTRQLRTWGKNVVRALIRQNVHGDGRKIAVSSLGDGGTSIKYIEDPPREIGFYAFWNSLAPLGNDVSKLTVRSGKIYTSIGTLTVAEQDIIPPAAGTGDHYYWVQVDYDFTGSGTQTATWKDDTTLPDYLVDTDTDGTYDQINLPILRLEEKHTGIWKIYQRQYGDCALRLYQDISSYNPWVRNFPFLAYWDSLAEIGSATDTMTIKAGYIYTPVGTVGTIDNTFTPGTGDKYYWMEINFDLSTTTGSVTASLQHGGGFPTYAIDTDSNGNYDQINLPICYVRVNGLGEYSIYQRQLGDAVVGIIGQDISLPICLNVTYSTSTGLFQKQTGTLQIIKGVVIGATSSPYSTVFAAQPCSTTTTTTTT